MTAERSLDEAMGMTPDEIAHLRAKVDRISRSSHVAQRGPVDVSDRQFGVRSIGLHLDHSDGTEVHEDLSELVTGSEVGRVEGSPSGQDERLLHPSTDDLLHFVDVEVGDVQNDRQVVGQHIGVHTGERAS